MAASVACFVLGVGKDSWLEEASLVSAGFFALPLGWCCITQYSFGRSIFYSTEKMEAAFEKCSDFIAIHDPVLDRLYQMFFLNTAVLRLEGGTPSPAQCANIVKMLEQIDKVSISSIKVRFLVQQVNSVVLPLGVAKVIVDYT